MSANLKFFDEEEQLINGQINKGLTRIGSYTISKFLIRNMGTSTARDVIITSTPFVESGNVEYPNQLLASSWKTFSFFPDKGFTNKLELGDILANGYSTGIKDTQLNMSSQDLFLFKDLWNTGINTYSNGRFTFSKMNGLYDGQIAKRMDCNAIGTSKNIEIEFSFDFAFKLNDETSPLNPFIAFPVRMNSNGDGKGYYWMVRIDRATNSFKVLLYKNGLGMTTNVDRDYGDKFIETRDSYPINPNTKVSLKVYNGKDGAPTFNVFINGELQVLNRAYSDTSGLEIKDTQSNRYANAGNFFFEISMYPGDYSLTMHSLKLSTENYKQFIYVKSLVGNSAVPNKEYLSSINVSYLEV